jgi:hypothetical protein
MAVSSGLIVISGHTHNRSEPTRLVESRCGAVAVGRTYLLPPLSSGGASLARPWLCFHTPLIEPDRRISRIRLSDKTSRLLSRATPSAVFRTLFGVARSPNLRVPHPSCVCLELTPLPSPGITRLQRYYEPLRHFSAPGLSLTVVRLILPDHALGFRVARFPCVHAAATTTVQQLGVLFTHRTSVCGTEAQVP